MLSKKEFEDLADRIKNGRKWFLENGGFNRLDTKYKQWVFQEWQILADKWLEEAVHHKAIKLIHTSHSPSWHEWKQQEAYLKWKRTVKAKRGTDPRTLPKEDFI